MVQFTGDYNSCLFSSFFLPFVVLPLGTSPFEIPKVLLAEIIIELLFLFVLFGKIPFSFTILPKHLLYTISGLFLISLFDLLFFQSPTVFFGNVYRLQGVFLLWHLLFFTIMVSQFIFFYIT